MSGNVSMLRIQTQTQAHRNLQGEISQLNARVLEEKDPSVVQDLLRQIQDLSQRESRPALAKMGRQPVKSVYENNRRIARLVSKDPQALIGPRVQFNENSFQEAITAIQNIDNSQQSALNAIRQSQEMARSQLNNANNQIAELERKNTTLTKELKNAQSMQKGVGGGGGLMTGGVGLEKINQTMKDGTQWLNRDIPESTPSINEYVTSGKALVDRFSEIEDSFPKRETFETSISEAFETLFTEIDAKSGQVNSKFADAEQKKRELELESQKQGESQRSNKLEKLQKNVSNMSQLAATGFNKLGNLLTQFGQSVQSQDELTDNQTKQIRNAAVETIFETAVVVNSAADVRRELIECNDEFQSLSSYSQQFLETLRKDVERNEFSNLATNYINQVERLNSSLDQTDVKKANDKLNNALNDFGNQFNISAGRYWSIFFSADDQSFKTLKTAVQPAIRGELDQQNAKRDIQAFIEEYDDTRKLGKLLDQINGYFTKTLSPATESYMDNQNIQNTLQQCRNREEIISDYRNRVLQLNGSYDEQKQKIQQRKYDVENEAKGKGKEKRPRMDESSVLPSEIGYDIQRAPTQQEINKFLIPAIKALLKRTKTLFKEGTSNYWGKRNFTNAKNNGKLAFTADRNLAFERFMEDIETSLKDVTSLTIKDEAKARNIQEIAILLLAFQQEGGKMPTIDAVGNIIEGNEKIGQKSIQDGILKKEEIASINTFINDFLKVDDDDDKEKDMTWASFWFDGDILLPNRTIPLIITKAVFRTGSTVTIDNRHIMNELLLRLFGSTYQLGDEDLKNYELVEQQKNEMQLRSEEKRAFNLNKTISLVRKQRDYRNSLYAATGVDQSTAEEQSLKVYNTERNEADLKVTADNIGKKISTSPIKATQLSEKAFEDWIDR